MKQFILTILLSTFIYPMDVNISNSLTSTKELKVAILPTISTNNPDKQVDYQLTGKFQQALIDAGFNVINSQIVQSGAIELEIDIEKVLTISDYKRLQEALSCDAVLVSNIDHNAVAETESGRAGASILGSGGGANSSYTSKGKSYEPSSESLSIIDYNTFTTYVDIFTGRIQKKKFRKVEVLSMSTEICKALVKEVTDRGLNK